MRRTLTYLFTLITIASIGSCCYGADNKSKPVQQKVVAPFSQDRWMQKMLLQHEILNEGRILAKQGMYDDAIKKYELAMDSSVLNRKGDAVYSLWAICTIYKYQGKLDEALDLFQKNVVPLNPKKQEYINMRIELKALIRARDTKNNKPIYDYINYIKTRYGEYLPPKGYSTTYNSEIGELIHLYDYLHDYDAGIAFIDEIIKYHTTNKDPNHRSATSRHVKDYARVKRAWELDKETGQHGHLQDVIRTSDIISW